MAIIMLKSPNMHGMNQSLLLPNKYYRRILRFVDRTSLYNVVNKANLVHNFP